MNLFDRYYSDISIVDLSVQTLFYIDETTLPPGYYFIGYCSDGEDVEYDMNSINLRLLNHGKDEGLIQIMIRHGAKPWHEWIKKGDPSYQIIKDRNKDFVFFNNKEDAKYAIYEVQSYLKSKGLIK